MRSWLRELLRVGHSGPVALPLALLAAQWRFPGHQLVAFGLLGKPRRGTVEVQVFRDGLRYSLDLREDSHRLMFLNLYERELRRRALALLPPGGCMVDVGANVGFWTIPAARAVGRGGKVIAIEPNPWAVERLQRNLALNQASAELGAIDV